MYTFYPFYCITQDKVTIRRWKREYILHIVLNSLFHIVTLLQILILSRRSDSSYTSFSL